ncbi:MAG: radical SAM protein [Deltaproteobacteria bacterium]|nr:radical SAM protein [Deltaproteobacteria bacterium]
MYERLFVGSQCNNNCASCSFAGEIRNIVSFSELRRKIDSMPGTNIEICGGEPTIREDFFQILDYANNAGFKRIKLCTNARMLSRWCFLKGLIQSNVKVFEISLFSSNPEIQNKLTATKSFSELKKALENIKRLELLSFKKGKPKFPYLKKTALIARIPVLEENLESLTETIGFLKDYGFSRVILDFHFTDFDFSKEIPRICKLFDYVAKKNLLVLSQGIPLCLLEGFEEHCIEIYSKPEKMPLLSECNECAFRKNCSGLHEKNAEHLNGKLKPLNQSKRLSSITDFIEGFK